MNLPEIKKAIADGKTVHWATTGYQVICDKIGQYLILCTSNGSCIGLTWADGITMNGKEDEFFIAEPHTLPASSRALNEWRRRYGYGI